MPELHDLSPKPGSHRDRKRLGRGPGSGTGKTSGRGHKGQGARSGGNVRRGFEGGQMPLQRRIPKRGFTNINRVEYQVVNVRDLAGMEAGEVTPEILFAHGMIGKLNQPVKILGTGEIEGVYQVSAHKFSGTAKAKIEAAGGTVTVVARGSSTDEAPAMEAASQEAASEAEPNEAAPAPEGDEAPAAEETEA